MSAHFRKARAVLAGLPDFPKTKLRAFVFSKTGRDFLEVPPKKIADPEQQRPAFNQLIQGNWETELIDRFVNNSAPYLKF